MSPGRPDTEAMDPASLAPHSVTHDSLAYASSRPPIAPPPVELTSRGRFRVGQEIGAGGMGRVSLVRDLRLLRDLAWKRGDWRLLREARILAQLEHPGITPVHDVGADPSGQAFIAMRVVRGQSLAERLRELPRAERQSLLRPVLQAIEAVAFAHHRGVIHRDLKPANVMLGRFGESQVVDWGLAHVDEEAEDPLPVEVRRAVATPSTGRVGTPGFMSPEQEEGRASDRRSDVFALGRILERLLPARSAPSELSAIVRKATAQDPDARYVDAGALAADLARYLDGRPVSAHAYLTRELVRRFVRRHRTPLLIAAIALVSLLALLAFYVTDIGAARHRAEDATDRARAALRRSDLNLARSLIGEARRQLAGGARAETEILAAHALGIIDDPDAWGLLASVGGAPAPRQLHGAPAPCPDAQLDAGRGLLLCIAPESVSLWSVDALSRPLWRHDASVRVAQLLDGGVAVGSSADWRITLLDLAGNVLHRVDTTGTPTRRSASRGGKVIFEGARQSVLVDIAQASVLVVHPCDGALHSAVEPTLDGASPLIALCRDGALRIGGGLVQTPFVAPVREAVRVAALPGGGVAVGTHKGEVAIVDAEGHVRVARVVVSGMVRALLPSPDGRYLAVVGEGAPYRILSLPGLADVASLPRRVATLQWDPGHPDELMTTGPRIERWRLEAGDSSGRPLQGATVIPLPDGVVAVDIAPRPTAGIIAASGPGVAAIGEATMTYREAGFITAKGAALEGSFVLSGGSAGVRVLAREDLHLSRTLSERAFRRFALLADGTGIAGGWGEVSRLVGTDFQPFVVGACLDLAVSPSRRFAVVLREADRAFFLVRAGEAVAVEVGAHRSAEAVAIDDSGERIATAEAGLVTLWRTDGSIERVLAAEGATLLSVALSPDGRWAVAGSREGAVLLWDLADPAQATPRARFFDHTERVPALAFSPSGRFFVSGSWDRTVRVRDLTVLDAHVGSLRARLERRYALPLEEVLR